MSVHPDTPGPDRPFGHNPFEDLQPTGLPQGPQSPTTPPAPPAPKPKSRGRVEIRRQKAGRGGVFAGYRLRVAGVLRDYGMNERRDQAPADSQALHGL
mgnify:CR=1 FL=1